MFKKDNNAWVLCPSKRFPGKYYYFNVLNGEAAWCLTDCNKPLKRNENIHNITDASHNYPEPTSPPNMSKYGPTFPNITQEFGQAVFPKYIPFTPHVVWKPMTNFLTGNPKSTEDKITQTDTENKFMTLGNQFTTYRNLAKNTKKDDTNTPIFGQNTQRLIKEPVLKFTKSPFPPKPDNIFLQTTNNAFFKINNKIDSNLEIKKTIKKPTEKDIEKFKVLGENQIDLSKLESNDLRLLLVRKRKTSEKEVQFTTDNNFKTSEEPTQSVTPKRLRFNLEPEDDDDDIQTQNMVENLSNLFLENQIQYVFVDIETFLDKLNIIEDYVVEDENRILLLPLAMKIEIEAFSRVNSRDIALVHAARKLMRKLPVQKQFVVLQNDREEHYNMSTNDIVLNYCINIGHKAILISNNSNLQKRASKFKIQCFNTEQLLNNEKSPLTNDWGFESCQFDNALNCQVDSQLTLTDNDKREEIIKDNSREHRENHRSPEDRLNKFTDNILKRFCVSSDIISNRVTSRSDELLCCFTQIMENAIINIIEPHTDQPYNLLEALIRLQNNCSDKTISNIIQNLKELLKKNSCQKGNIKKDIDFDDFMKIIGCGVVLLENLKSYRKDLDISDACECMNYLVNNIVDPKTDNDIVSEIIINEGKIETRDVIERKIYKKDPSEVLNYVMKHYPDNHNNTKCNEPKKNSEKPKIVRTLGKDLNLIKIDKRNNLTMTNNDEVTKKAGPINREIDTKKSITKSNEKKSITKSNEEKSITKSNDIDVISIDLDSGIENDNCQAYSLAKTFFYELSTTFVEVHDFINEVNILIQKNKMDDDSKKRINNRVKKTLEYVEKITEKLRRIIDRENDEETSIRNYLLKAGEDATSDRRMVKYEQVIKKCLEQWSYSQSALKIMLALTDFIYKENFVFDDSSLTSVHYINIFE